MRVTSRSCTSSSECGQTTIEFALALIVVIAGICGLYQALHFELDVFNRLAALRQMVFRTAHENQENTRRETFSHSIDFKPLALLTPAPVPFQIADPTLRYASKSYYARRGTRYWDELFPFSAMNEKWTVFLMLHGEHYQGTAGLFKRPFEIASIRVPCSFWISPTMNVPGLSYMYIDAP